MLDGAAGAGAQRQHHDASGCRVKSDLRSSAGGSADGKETSKRSPGKLIRPPRQALTLSGPYSILRTKASVHRLKRPGTRPARAKWCDSPVASHTKQPKTDRVARFQS